MNSKALRGYLVGMAVGDSLGLPYEGMSADQGRRRLGAPSRHRLVFGRGMVSDDTEHAVLTLLAAVESGGDVEVFPRLLAGKLKAWLFRLPAGVGFATLRSLLRLCAGISPKHSGVYSAGNGPAMRSGVLGLMYGDSLEQLASMVGASTRMTHSDPSAYLGAMLYAQAVHMAAGRDTPNTHVLMQQFSEIAQDLKGCESWMGKLHQVIASVEANQPVSDFAEFLGSRGGISGYILHTVLCVLQVWLRGPDDFRGGLTEVIEAGGDTDTTGALLAGLIGVRTGEEVIPIEWRTGLRDAPLSIAYLHKLADAVGQKQPVPKPSATVWVLRNVWFTMIVLTHGLFRLIPRFGRGWIVS